MLWPSVAFCCDPGCCPLPARLPAHRSVQQATAISLAQLAPTGAELKSIFVDKPGLDVLLELLTDETATASKPADGHSWLGGVVCIWAD